MVGVIPPLPRHNGPQYSGILVCQSNHSFLPSSSITELLNPQEDRVVILASQCNCLGTLNEQGTQINASSLGNTAQAILAATGVLLRRQTQPCCELRTIFELSKVTYSGNESRCSDRSDAHQFGCTLDLFIRFLVISNTLITPLNMRIKLAPVILCSLQNEARNTGNIVAGIFNHIAKMVTQHLGTLREYNAKLRQQSANSVDAGSALLFETLSESMHAKHALLSQCFGRNKIDMRPRRCLTDCRSVVRIVLTRTTLYSVRHHRRGWDHARIESALSQFATPVVGTAASLHRNQATGWQISAPKQELIALQCAVSNDFSCAIHSVNLNDIFRQIDANSDNLVHGTFPSVSGLRTILQRTSHGHRGPLPGSGKSLRIHIGVDSESGLVHTVRGTAAHISDVTEGNSLLHGQEEEAYGDAGYQGIENRPDAKKEVLWHIAMRPGKRAALDLENKRDALTEKIEKAKAGIRAKVEHPFRVIKRQFGFIKVRYRGLKKNTAQLVTLFALSNLWMARGKLMGIGA